MEKNFEHKVEGKNDLMKFLLGKQYLQHKKYEKNTHDMILNRLNNKNFVNLRYDAAI